AASLGSRRRLIDGNLRREVTLPGAYAATHVLDGLPAVLRAQAFVAGIYVMQESSPDEWRNFARRALFAVERPYLG
ncbi:hypothetical protein, partial [Burkholderia ubonensis]|uniref:hypothetical protein n=1 Tax=Burkholderia ubonensis TaxID=101571 RepID=UPI001E3DDFC7